MWVYLKSNTYAVIPHMANNEERKTGLFGVPIPELTDPKVQEIIKGLQENKKDDLQQKLDLDSFIILPGRKHGAYEYPDVLVSMKRTNYGKIKWAEAHFKLAEENSFMLTPAQFFDFIGVLKKGPSFDGNGQKIDTKKMEHVLAGIIGVSADKEEEYFDAQFKDMNGLIYISSGHTIMNEKLIPSRIEKLEARITEKSYIDFFSMNNQGMPTKKGTDMKYIPPEGNCVVGLHNTEYPPILCCGNCATCSGKILQHCVRQAKIR